MEYKKPKKGLILKPKWCDLILNGNKTMELRSSNTKIRGTIGLIKSGTGLVYGTIDIIDSVELDEEMFLNTINKHCVNCNRKDISYKKLYGWILSNPIKYEAPIPYSHKLGCVIWVNL